MSYESEEEKLNCAVHLSKLKASITVGYDPIWDCATRHGSYKNLASVKFFLMHKAHKIIQNKTSNELRRLW